MRKKKWQARIIAMILSMLMIMTSVDVTPVMAAVKDQIAIMQEEEQDVIEEETSTEEINADTTASSDEMKEIVTEGKNTTEYSEATDIVDGDEQISVHAACLKDSDHDFVNYKCTKCGVNAYYIVKLFDRYEEHDEDFWSQFSLEIQRGDINYDPIPLKSAGNGIFFTTEYFGIPNGNSYYFRVVKAPEEYTRPWSYYLYAKDYHYSTYMGRSYTVDRTVVDYSSRFEGVLPIAKNEKNVAFDVYPVAACDETIPVNAYSVKVEQRFKNSFDSEFEWRNIGSFSRPEQYKFTSYYSYSDGSTSFITIRGIVGSQVRITTLINDERFENKEYVTYYTFTDNDGIYTGSPIIRDIYVKAEDPKSKLHIIANDSDYGKIKTELFLDKECKNPLIGADEKPYAWEPTTAYQFNSTKWFPYQEKIYAKITNIPEGYIEQDGEVLEIKLNPAKETDYKIQLHKCTEVKLAVRVYDSFGSSSMDGFKLKLYEYNSETDSYEEVDNGHTYAYGYSYGYRFEKPLVSNAKNQGKFYVTDVENDKGYVPLSETMFDISGKTGTVNVDLSKTRANSLLDILEKNEDGSNAYEVSITQSEKRDKEKVIASTKEDTYSMKTTLEDVLRIDIFNARVDEKKVKDNVVYNLELPNELTPTLDNTNNSLSDQWLSLDRIGNVYAYGRIIKKNGSVNDINADYIFQIYFQNTKGKKDISFEFHYFADINKELVKDGMVETVFPYNKELSFPVVMLKDDSEISVKKKMMWTVKTDHSVKGPSKISAVTPGSTPYNELAVEIECENPSGKKFSAELVDTIDSNLAWYNYITEEKDLLVEFYIKKTPDGEYERITKTSNMANEPLPNNKPADFQTFKVFKQEGTSYYAFMGEGTNASHFHQIQGIASKEKPRDVYISLKNIQGYGVKVVYYLAPVYTGGKVPSLMTSLGSVYKYQNEDSYHTQLTGSVEGNTITPIDTTASKEIGKPSVTLSTATQLNETPNSNPNDPLSSVNKITYTTKFTTGGDSFVDVKLYPFCEPYISAGPPYSSANYFFKVNMLMNNDYMYIPEDLVIKINGENIKPTYVRQKLYGSSKFPSMSNEENHLNQELTKLLEEQNGLSFDNLAFYQYRTTVNGRQVVRHMIVASDTRNDAVKAGFDTYGNGPEDNSLLDKTTGLPLGYHIYFVGLDGNEEIEITYSKYQRGITPFKENYSRSNVDQAFSGSSQYLGEVVTVRNSVYQEGAYQIEEDKGAKQRLTKKGTVLPDGSVRWDLKLEVDYLEDYISRGISYNNFNAYLYFFEDIPEGYVANASVMGYDDDFNANMGGKYRSGLIYFCDKDENISDYVMNSWNDVETASDKFPTRYFKKNGINENEYQFYVSYFNLRNYVYEEDGHKYINMCYIMTPKKDLKPTTSNLTSSTEICLMPNYMGPYTAPDKFVARFMDTVASASVIYPGIENKNMVQDKDELNLTHNEILSTQFKDEISVYSIFDTMEDTVAVNEKNEVICDIAGKYYKLTNVVATITDKNGVKQTITMPIEDQYITLYGDDNKFLLRSSQNIPMFGYNKYSYEDQGVKVDIIYAPERSSYGEYNEKTLQITNRPHYAGGDYYGMKGGFEIRFSGLDNTKQIKVEYDTVFDYEEFANDYPGAGKTVTINADNSAYRSMDTDKDVEGAANATMDSFSFALAPAVDKDFSNSAIDTEDMTQDEKDIADAMGTYQPSTYTVTSDIGAAAQDNVYLVDQIFNVEDYIVWYDRDTRERKKSTYKFTPEEIADFIKFVDLKDLKIVAKSRINSSESVVFEDGEAADGWIVTPVDKSTVEDVEVTETGKKLDGNVFNLNVSKADGSVIPGETYFEITYDLAINPESTDDQGRIFREMPYYKGGQLKISNQAAIAIHINYDEDQQKDPDITNGEESPATQSNLDSIKNTVKGIFSDILDEEPVVSQKENDPTQEWVAAGATVEDLTYLRQPEGDKVPLRDEVSDDGIQSTKWSVSAEVNTAGKNEKVDVYYSDFVDYLTTNVKDDEINEKLIEYVIKHTKISDYEAYYYELMAPAHKNNAAKPEYDSKKIAIPFKETTDGKYIFEDADGHQVTVIPVKNIKESWTYHKKEELSKDFEVGYATWEFFDVEAKNFDYLSEVDVEYVLSLDWPAFREDVLSDELLTEAQLKTLIINYTNAVDGDIEPVSQMQWAYPAALKGTIYKKGTKDPNDGYAVNWEIGTTLTGLNFKNFVMEDQMESTYSSESYKKNAQIAIDNTKVTALEIVDAQGNVLYEHTAGFEKDKEYAIPDKADVWSNAVLTFTPGGFKIVYGTLYAGADLTVNYKTKLDYVGFVNDGGDSGIYIYINNVVTGVTTGTNMRASSNVTIFPSPGGSIKKSAVNVDRRALVNWDVVANIGDSEAYYFTIEDNCTVTDTLADYVCIKNMKVELTPADGEKKTIYDSEEDIDLLSDYHLEWSDDFKLNSAGDYSFKLLFNKDKESGLVFPANSQIELIYQTDINNDSYPVEDRENAVATMNNKAVFRKNGGPAGNTSTRADIFVREFMKKECTRVQEYEYSTNFTWKLTLNLTEQYSMEELKNCDHVTVTDVLPANSGISFSGLNVGYTTTYGNGQTYYSSMPKSAYSAESNRRRYVITLMEPAKYPNVEIEITGYTTLGSSMDVNNTMELEIFGEKHSVDAPTATKGGKKGGLVRSTEIRGQVSVTKIDALTEKPLKDVEFELHYQASNGGIGSKISVYKEDEGVYFVGDEGFPSQLSTITTDEFGEFYIKNLPYGNYVIIETKQPDGYRLTAEDVEENTYKFSIDDDCFTKMDDGSYAFKAGVNDVTLKNVPTYLRIHKYYDQTIAGEDKTGDVKGAKLEVWNADKSELIASGVTDKYGIMEVSKIEPGEYVLVEATVPYGFTKADDIPFEIDETGCIVDSDFVIDGVLSMEDEYVTGDLSITKTGEVFEDKGFVQGLLDKMIHTFTWKDGNLSDVTFDIYAAKEIKIQDEVIYNKDQKIGTITTDADGVATMTNLPIGDYYAVEAGTNEGYNLDKTKISLVLTYKDELTPVVTVEKDFNNERMHANIKVTKVDADTNEPLAGAIFALCVQEKTQYFDADDIVAIAVSDAEGIVDFETDIPVGAYYIKELAAPEGYLLSEETYPFTFSKDGQTVKYTAKNEKRELFIYKVNENEELIGGCILELIDENGDSVDKWTTATGKKHSIPFIEPGTYTLHEVQPTLGYFPAEDVTVVIGEDDIKVSATMVDEGTKVSILKIDKATKAPLAGAKFKLLDGEKNVIATWTSTDKPYELVGIAPGEYMLYETKAPDGYAVMDPMTITIEETKDVQEFVAENEQLPEEIVDEPISDDAPRTGDMTSPAVAFALLLLAMMGFILAIVTRRKKTI